MEFLYKKSALLNEQNIRAQADGLLEYIQHLKKVKDSENYDFPESSINLAFDKELLKQVQALAEEKAAKPLKYIIVVGIGGSNLGTKAVYDALYGFFDILEPNRFPKMFFVDTNDTEFLSKFKKFLNKQISSPDEIFVNVISKSGSTTETIANAEFILQELKRFKGIKNRLAVVTDFESNLWNRAKVLNMARLAIPKLVGGRYSVLSAVGLFPLALSGIDIKSLRDGAGEMLQRCLKNDLGNPALVSAVLTFLNYKAGKDISGIFLFHSELESLGKWYAQLMGESIGKEKDIKGITVNVGITPIVSIGSTDLHSVGQLFLGGPKDKFTCFISTKLRLKRKIEIPKAQMFSELVPNIGGRGMTEIMSAILEGVKIAYTKHKLPFAEVILNDVSPKSIGEFLQWKMVEMMFLGKLMNVNPFDQPDVESYKAETKRILSKD